MNAEILPTHTPALFQAAVLRAAELLRAGELVALPTETVYGLAANALDNRAVASIFAAKGRPAHNPIIVHVASLELAQLCVAEWPESASQLARAFWPGPLTLVLPRAQAIPDIVTAGGPTVGVRWPSHPFIQAVIRECGFPLAAPSANPANRLSPTNADHVAASMGDKVRLIIDGGQSQVGIESTVVDLGVRPPRVLRPGMIGVDALQAALPECGDFGELSRDVRSAETSASSVEPCGIEEKERALRSPGQLPRHYAPRAQLVVLSWRDGEDLEAQVSRFKHDPAKTCIVSHTIIPPAGHWGRVSVIPHDAEAFARSIYAELHRCDELGAELIVVEALPESNEWQAIADRLKRATAI